MEKLNTEDGQLFIKVRSWARIQLLQLTSVLESRQLRSDS